MPEPAVPDLDRHREALAAWLDSPFVTAPTRAALTARLAERFERRSLDPAHFERLRQLSAVLVPHDPAVIDLAGALDDRLARGAGDGWRYADTPPDGAAIRGLLEALPDDLVRLDAAAQTRVVQGLQSAHPHAFEDLLAELTGYYYSHPLVQLDLGCLSFADAPDWTHLGLDDPDPREVAGP